MATTDTSTEAQGRRSWTIDELAQVEGVPVSTLRMYQNKGLIAPPLRRGRVGYYGPGHRERLALVGRLQERGFSLASIKEMLDLWLSGTSLDTLMGGAPPAASTDGEPVERPATLRLSPNEFADRFDGVVFGQEEMGRAVNLGLVELDADNGVILRRRFGEIAPMAAALGVGVSVVLDEYEAMAYAVGVIAERFESALSGLSEPAQSDNANGNIDEAVALRERLVSASVSVISAALQRDVARRLAMLPSESELPSE